jgi:hypothetical protein
VRSKIVELLFSKSKQTHKQAVMDPGGGDVPVRRGGAGKFRGKLFAAAVAHNARQMSGIRGNRNSLVA